MFMWVILCAAAAADNSTDPTQVLLDRIVYHSQGWGEMGVNTCAHAPDKTPSPMRIGGTDYAQGLGAHANAETCVELDGQFAAFEAEIGVQWQGPNVGSVIFQVYVDNEKRFDSGIMKETDPARPIRINTLGASLLKLVVKDAGDGITCDCGNWANARLIADPNAPKPSEQAGLDIGAFAYVRSWDPRRMTGTLAKRTEEFPAEDVFLGKDLLPDGLADAEPDLQSKRAPDAVYTVPTDADGVGCIGLEWAERRFLRNASIEFVDAASMPAVQDARLEYWTGESPWQGEWKRLDGEITADGLRWAAAWTGAKSHTLQSGTEKIRWILPKHAQPIRVRALAAGSRSALQQVTLRIERDKDRPSVKPGQMELYNGLFTDAPDKYSRACPDGEPFSVQLTYCLPGPWKTDRTALRFLVHLPTQFLMMKGVRDEGLAVAVEDVLATGAVYVPEAGLYVTTDPAPMTLAEYKQKIAGQKTVLERVREMPDQTFAQAMEHVHNPVQDLGPMMISLACDNRKFVVQREGAITFEPYANVDQDPIFIPKSCTFTPGFGSGKPESVTRHLDGGWLPAPVNETGDNGVALRQRSFVAPVGGEAVPDSNGWLYDKTLCVAEFTLSNRSGEAKTAEVHLGVSPGEAHVSKLGASIGKDGRLLAFTPAPGGTMTIESNQGGLVLKAALAPNASAGFSVLIPAWNATEEDLAALADTQALFAGFQRYWEQTLAQGMQVETPDAFLNDVIRASQVHCLLAARNEERGKRIAAWISSDRYGPLESESNAVIRGMDLMGNHEFARRAHDFFIHRYNPQGFLTTGYTLMGTGWHLWTLSEHFMLTRDEEWFRAAAPEVERVCQWVLKQREKTQARDGKDWKMPESGLIPPGVAADWNRYAYRFAAQGHYCLGLFYASAALQSIGYVPEENPLADAASAFMEDIGRAFVWNQQRTPVLPLSNGTWVAGYPGMLYCYGRIEDIIPGEDGNRSWAYDVEVGAHHLIAQGGDLAAALLNATQIMDHMEDCWFLHSGMGDYPEEKNRADWFNLGGFSKVQPYYTRNAEIYGILDDVKPFIRSYFNTVPAMLSRENLSFWEHFHNTGGWNKTHETGYFLAQTRIMFAGLVGGDPLPIAPFVTNNWMNDGQRVVVKNAPTVYGPVSYTIESHAAQGFIQAHIEPPTWETPKEINVRLRHPEGKAIKEVQVTGAENAEVDEKRECVSLTPTGGPIDLKAIYP